MLPLTRSDDVTLTNDDLILISVTATKVLWKEKGLELTYPIYSQSTSTRLEFTASYFFNKSITEHQDAFIAEEQIELDIYENIKLLRVSECNEESTAFENIKVKSKLIDKTNDIFNVKINVNVRSCQRSKKDYFKIIYRDNVLCEYIKVKNMDEMETFQNPEKFSKTQRKIKWFKAYEEFQKSESSTQTAHALTPINHPPADLISEVNKLNQKVKKLNRTVIQLTQENAQLKQNYASLSDRLNALEDERTTKKARISAEVTPNNKFEENRNT